MQPSRDDVAARALDQRDLDFFDTHGYLVCRNLITADEMSHVAEECDALAANHASGRALYYFEPSSLDPGRQILRRVEKFVEKTPAIRRLLASDRILGRASQLMKRPALLFKDKLNLKLPGGGGFQPHCDGHFLWRDQQGRVRRGWEEYGPAFITALISIDRATVENGCLELASTDEAGPIIGRSFDEILGHTKGEGPEIAEQYMAMLHMKPVPTDAGDVLFFDWRAPHGSHPNGSNMPRRLLYITYSCASEGDRRLEYYAGKAESPRTPLEKAFG